jgi:hypothetical protein
MSDDFVTQAKEQRNVFERLLKGLPGVRGYTDKELRRNADYRLRQMIGDELDTQKAALLDAQNKLLHGGGLAFLDDLDVGISKLQTLADRIRTASYGYAGLFDAVRIREDELDALRRFDVALLAQVANLEAAIKGLGAALGDRAQLGAQIEQVIAAVTDLTGLFDRRERVILSPDALTGASADLPEVDTRLQEMADAAEAAGTDVADTAGPSLDSPAADSGSSVS